jgi:hypothetical protein
MNSTAQPIDCVSSYLALGGSLEQVQTQGAQLEKRELGE